MLMCHREGLWRPGLPTNCYYDSVSDPSARALYVAFGERGVVKISPLP